jgi:predicted acylesterase/phospholipase RssA
MVAVLCGCATLTPRLEAIDANKPGYRLGRPQLGQPKDPRDRLFVIVTLSGGGTRAAAFAYGALEAMRDTSVVIDGENVALLDEVDVISSVSGGSFAAAYYAAFGQEKFFTHFRAEVLNRKIERAIALRILAPWNWLRLLSPRVSRSDLAAEYYDRAIFKQVKYRHLPERPLILLNATDLEAGAPFSFDQATFDALCADLSEFPVARAVTASSAFPVAFPPLTLQNWRARYACGYQTPLSVSNALESGPQENVHDYERAKETQSFGRQDRRYLHLSDGGIGDNLGLRALVAGLTSANSPLPIQARLNAKQIDRLVLISVDAKPGVSFKHGTKASPPGFLSVLSRASSAPMANYSTDSIEWMRSHISVDSNQFDDALERRRACDERGGDLDLCYRAFRADVEHFPHCFDFFGVHIQFEQAPAAVRDKLQGVGTRLQLPHRVVQLLIDESRRQVLESEEIENLKHALRNPDQSRCARAPREAPPR